MAHGRDEGPEIIRPRAQEDVEHDLEAVLRHRCPPYLPLSLKDWVRSAAEVNVDLVGLQVHAADEVEMVSSLGGYLE